MPAASAAITPTSATGVSEGDPLVTVDLARLAELGVDAISPVVAMSGESVEVVASGSVDPGDPLLKVSDT